MLLLSIINLGMNEIGVWSCKAAPLVKCRSLVLTAFTPSCIFLLLITFSYLLSAGHISPLLTSKLCTSSPPPCGLRLCNLSSVGGKAVELALGLSGCTKPPVSLRFPWSITNRPLNLKTREFVLLQKKILKSCWLITGVRFSFMLVANVCKLIYQGVQRGLKLENGFQHVPFRGCCAPLMLL